MFSSQDNEFARNTHFTENWVFLKIHYFKKETFVRVETFRIFYGPWNLYMGRISGRNYVIHRGKMLFDFGIFLGFKIQKIRLSPLPVAHCHKCIPIFDYVIRWTHPRQYKVSRSNMRILGVRRESREYNENPRSTVEILGVQWESWEYDGNPGSTAGIHGVQWKSQKSREYTIRLFPLGFILVLDNIFIKCWYV